MIVADSGMSLTVGEILKAFSDLVRRRWVYLVTASLGFAAAYEICDFAIGPRDSNLVNISAIFVTYIYIERLLIAEGLAPQKIESSRRFGSYFAVGIASGLGILLGTLLFVIPGLWLAARWSLSSVFVVGQGHTTSKALAASTAATARSRWAIVGAYVVIWAIVLVPFGILAAIGLIAVTKLDAPDHSAAQLVGNLFAGAVQPVNGMLSVALYALLVGYRAHLEEIFA